MHLKTYILIILCLLLSNQIEANPNYVITTKQLQSHVNFLGGDALEGRLPGSKGEILAANYIASFFHQLGLEPAGDSGSFFQTFPFTAGVFLGENNFLSIKKKSLKLNQTWRPLSFSNTASFKNIPLIWAEYGITAPATGKLPAYDSYLHLNVKNKWVVVFKDLPEKSSKEHYQQLRPYASLRYKAFNAKEKGAKGIIFLSNDLISLSSEPSLSHSGIVALSVKSSALKDFIKHPNREMMITGQTEIKKNIKQGRNVLAKLRIDGKTKPLLIVSAHLDHLGHGELGGSRARKNEANKIHPGADDNASGVASILETAAYLSDLKAQGKLKGNKDILFAAFSGEELGIIGSSHFINHFMKTHPNQSTHTEIDAAINLDMVGHLRKNLVLQGLGSSSDWKDLIRQIKNKHSITLITQNDPYLPTDSTAFYLQGIPTVNFFSGAHDDYHTPRDKPETLNYQGIKIISEYLVDFILRLEDRPNRLSYQKIKKTNDRPEREFSIYLGTIPDYASSETSGVKISGTTLGSPADHAGLKQGDTIVELAGKPIHDIYDYTFIINALRVSEPTPLIILRGGQKMALVIIPQYRE